MAEPAIKRLGTFLADLTQDKPPDQIHQEILARLRDPEQDLDHRLAGIYLHVKDFVPIWMAIRNGVSLPASSWETVVLPVVVHFSPRQNVKPNLETVTSLFLNARGVRALEADPAPPPVEEPPRFEDGSAAPPPAVERPLLDDVFDDGFDNGFDDGFDDGFDEEPPAESAVVAARTGRRWVPQAAAVAIVAIAAVAFWSGRDSGGGTRFSALPKAAPVVTVPSSEPSASPSPSESPSPTPSSSPEPSTTTPQPPRTSAPPRIPSAPMGLTSPKQDRTSIMLTWQAPHDASNVAYYRVFQNGVALNPTMATAETLIGLAPGTSYTFVVRAYNRLHQQSPPSNSLTVRTADPPPTTISATSPVPFGSSFNVGGVGWPCSDVQIFIGGYRVETGKAGASGGFDATINVHPDAFGEPGWVTDLDTGNDFQLTPGWWSIRAACPGGPERFTSITVV